jgi:hypothetical protein
VRGITAGFAGGDLGAVGAAITPLLIEFQPLLKKVVMKSDDAVEEAEELWDAGVRALAFACALGQAQDAKSAAAAIEAFVAPPGGYTRKRLDYAGTPRYLTLQSYVGVNGGAEWVWGGEFAGVVAPMASLGAEVGWPGQKAWNEGYALGLYLPVLDLGGIASVRLKENTQTAPVGIRQVLSPGGYLTLALPRTPISAGLGGTFRPGLRQRAGEPANAVEVGAFLAMDLVLLP